MGIDLDETARTLIRGTGESRYLRAIRLFEFQICLFHAGALVSTKDTAGQKAARLLAALKLLEYLQTRILAGGERSSVSWHDVSKDPDCAEIFDKIIFPSGGWPAIRNTWRTKTFDEDLRARRDEARTAIKIVDFSYRFAMLRPDDKRKVGATMARSIICNSPSYEYDQGLSTLKTRWGEYGPTAALLYLLFAQKFDLMPRFVNSAKFSERLLEQAADVGHLTLFFQAYRHLCEVLRSRGYRFPPIQVEGNLTQPLLADPFPRDVEEAIKSYTSAEIRAAKYQLGTRYRFRHLGQHRVDRVNLRLIYRALLHDARLPPSDTTESVKCRMVRRRDLAADQRALAGCL
jgi:hypothetical protein